MSYAFSLSGGDRIALCPASAVLDPVHEITERSSRGATLAAYRVACAQGSPEEALALMPEADREWLAQIDFGALGQLPGTYAPEVAFCYDTATGEAHELGRQIFRQYESAALMRLGRALRATEVVGAADAVLLPEDRAVVVDDKLGWAAHVPPALHSRQLRGLALCASIVYQREHVTVAVIRSFEDGRAWVDVAELDSMELFLIRDELAEMVASVRAERAHLASGGTPRVTLGSHCRYCPARRLCPGQHAWVRAVSSGQVGAALDLDDDDLLAEIWDKLPSYRRFLSEVESAIELRAKQRPFALKSGKWLGERVTEEIGGYDAKAVQQVLTELHGPVVGDAAVELRTSGHRIEEALRRKVEKRGDLKRLKDEATRALEKAKAIHRRRVREVVEFKATREEVEGFLELKAKHLAMDPTRGMKPIPLDCSSGVVVGGVVVPCPEPEATTPEPPPLEPEDQASLFGAEE